MKRLRYSVSDEQWALIEEAGKVLGVEPKLVLQLCTSIGLRFLDFSVIHPMNVGISKAIDERAAQGAAGILSGFGKVIGPGMGAGSTVASAGPKDQAKEKPRGKKASGKRK